jgi:hypothetical protein
MAIHWVVLYRVSLYRVVLYRVALYRLVIYWDLSIVAAVFKIFPSFLNM